MITAKNIHGSSISAFLEYASIINQMVPSMTRIFHGTDPASLTHYKSLFVFVDKIMGIMEECADIVQNLFNSMDNLKFIIAFLTNIFGKPFGDVH
jgi:hypothetical protein